MSYTYILKSTFEDFLDSGDKEGVPGKTDVGALTGPGVEGFHFLCEQKAHLRVLAPMRVTL